MKKLLLALALLPGLLLGATVNVQKDNVTNVVTGNVVVGSGKSIKVNSGGSMILAAGSTFTLPSGSVNWASLTGTPTTIVGYGITDPIVYTSGSYADPSWITSMVATKLTGQITPARFPAFTGDITTSAGAVATTLATVNSSPGMIGSGTAIPVITVNGKGLITTSSTATVTPVWSNITSTPTTATGYGITNGATIDLWGAKAIPSGTVIGATDSQTLTNKTISGASNTLSAIGNGSLTNSSLTIGSTSVSLGGTAATVAGLSLTAPSISAGTASSLTGLSIRDTSAAFDVTLSATSSTTLTAGRSLTIDLVNANKTIKLTGSPTLSGVTVTGTGTVALGSNNLTVNGASTINQDVSTSASPTFTGVSAALTGNASTATALQNARTINGTSFDGTGNVGQDLRTSASPAFVAVTAALTGNASTATALQNSRTIGGSSFDGTGNVTSFPTPGAIGGTTPAAGSFTTVSGTSTITDSQSLAANTSGDGVILTNPTAATSSNQRYSPRIRLTGQGWKTTSTAASQTVDWIIENQPVQGTTSPSSMLNVGAQVNGGGYSYPLQITSAGIVSLGLDGGGGQLLQVFGSGGVVNITPVGVSTLSNILLQSASLTTIEGPDEVKIKRGGSTVGDFTSGGFTATGTTTTTTFTTATHTPSSASDTGVAGTITWDASFVYVCTATNTWKRVAIASW